MRTTENRPFSVVLNDLMQGREDHGKQLPGITGSET